MFPVFDYFLIIGFVVESILTTIHTNPSIPILADCARLTNHSEHRTACAGAPCPMYSRPHRNLVYV